MLLESSVWSLLLTVDTLQQFRSVQCDKSVVSVRQSTHAVILDVTFVVEGVQTLFLYLHRLQSVVSRTEGFESTVCGRLVSKDVKKLLVTHILVCEWLFYSLDFDLWLCFVLGHFQTVHLSSQSHKFLWYRWSGFTLKLSQDSVIFFWVEGVVFVEIGSIEEVQILLHVGVQVVGLDMTTEAVRVCEVQTALVTILWFHVFVIERVHYQLG